MLPLEAVQRRVTRLVPNLAHLTYSDKPKPLNFPSLYCRRLRMDMIMAHGLKLLKPHVKANVKTYRFAVRMN